MWLSKNGSNSVGCSNTSLTDKTVAVLGRHSLVLGLDLCKQCKPLTQPEVVNSGKLARCGYIIMDLKPTKKGNLLPMNDTNAQHQEMAAGEEIWIATCNGEFYFHVRWICKSRGSILIRQIHKDYYYSSSSSMNETKQQSSGSSYKQVFLNISKII